MLLMARDSSIGSMNIPILEGHMSISRRMEIKVDSTTGGTVAMNRCSFMFLILLSACGADDRGWESQAKILPKIPSQDSYIVNSSAGSLGEIYAGMSKSELSSMRHPQSHGSALLEGEEYEVVKVTLWQVEIDCILDEKGNVHRFSTYSILVRDERGAGVGTRVAELKEKYPGGKVLIGDEDGRFASFVNGSRIIFVLDQNSIDDSCFNDLEKKCELDEKGVKVKQLVVSSAAAAAS